MLNGEIEAGLVVSIEGAFERRGRRIGVGGFVEPCRVRWLTVDGIFADLRCCENPPAHPHALDAAQGFSGRVAVRGDSVTWFHDLDTEPRPADHADTAQIVGRGDHLVELGEGYEERWERVDSGRSLRAVAEWGGDRSARTSPTVGRIVTVDHLAIAIWRLPEAGGAAFEHGTEWRPPDVVGAPFDGDLTAAVAALANGERLPSPWAVVVAPG